MTVPFSNVNLSTMIIELITLVVVILIILFLLVSFSLTMLGYTPFLPTTKYAYGKILEHSGIKKGDIVYDIGAGDGRLIHYAEKLYGAKATGFEINPFVYYLARFKQVFFGWKGKIIQANMLKQDLSDADCIVCYMTPEIMTKFQNKFENKLKKGTKILSYVFKVGTMKPFKIIPKDEKTNTLWIYKI